MCITLISVAFQTKRGARTNSMKRWGDYRGPRLTYPLRWVGGKHYDRKKERQAGIKEITIGLVEKIRKLRVNLGKKGGTPKQAVSKGKGGRLKLFFEEWIRPQGSRGKRRGNRGSR